MNARQNNHLSPYWPDRAHVDECLRTEAETADEALLLAVHEPVTLLRRPAQKGAAATPASETDLLQALMRPADDGSAVLVAITGASGVGKSHMVRWLMAQLERDPRREQLVIVIIPKTASLRRVVELILEPLAGTEYDALRRDLAHAAETLNPETAAEMLSVTLAAELEPYAERIKQDIQARRLSPEFGHHILLAQHLRTLLRDPDVRDLWLRKALLRIVGASLGGTADPSARQFQPADLEPPAEAAAGQMKQAVDKALAYLASHSGRYRIMAAEIIQELLDPALRTIFRFTEALHHRSLDDIVDEIRMRLLAEGKELVLLVEDLAALSGIQEPLLKIMIAESDHKGVRVRAPIRSAIAVTDGFLAGRMTVLTRAREEWVVPSEGLGEEAIVQRLVNLAGRYLNAARWGLLKLQQAFRQSPRNGQDLYGWVPLFDLAPDAEAADQLDAFGRSAAGHHLFPFNATAIRSLAATALRAGDVWTFNPRAFINEVLRKTLLERTLFENRRFPPPGFCQARLAAEIDQELQFRGYSAEETARLRTALFHWARNPRSLAVPSVEKPVFDAFNLPWPFDAMAPPPPRRRSELDTARDTSRITNETTPLPILPSAYAEALEKWTSEVRLPSPYHRTTRELLTAALNERIDFDEFRLHGLKVDQKWLWLPPANTVGNPSQGIVIRVMDPDQDIAVGAVAGLKALERWFANGRSWAYPDAETDYASANALLEDLEARVLEVILEEAHREAATLAAALHRQNLLLGVSTKTQPDASNLKDLLATVSDQPQPAIEGVPHRAKLALDVRRKALSGRVQLQERLREYVGCFQGSRGEKLLALDTERVKRILGHEPAQRWVLALKGGGALDDDALDALERLSPQRIDDLLESLAFAIAHFQPSVASAFGDDHQRVAWREELLQTIEQTVRLSMWPNSIAEKPLRAAVARLSEEGTESALRRIRKMVHPEPGASANARLAAMSTVPLPRLAALATDVALLEDFFDALERLVEAQTSSVDDANALKQHQALIDSLVWED